MFVPVAFIPGISGELFQQFAVAVSVSMVISAINALALVARRLRGPAEAASRSERGTHPLVLRASIMRAMATSSIVRRLVRFAALGLVLLGGAACGTGWLFKTTPTGFLPSEDQGHASAKSFCRKVLGQPDRTQRPSASRRSSAPPRAFRRHVGCRLQPARWAGEVERGPAGDDAEALADRTTRRALPPTA